MQKSLLIQAITVDTGLSKRNVSVFLESMIKIISITLKKDQPLQIIGFGSFKVVKNAAHKGRSPRTGEIIDIKANKRVKFKIGKTLRDLIRYDR